MLGCKVTFPHRPVWILAFILAITVLATPAATQETEATSTITLVKTAKPKGEAEEYRVREGEHLWQILRKRLDGGTERQIARLYRKTLRLNPGLDPNEIEPGQVLLLPPLPGAPAAKPKAEPAPVAEAQVQLTPLEAEALRARAARAGAGLSALYAELGEETVSEGKHFIPLADTGQMVLDATKFPLLQVGGNTRFVLDLNARIPTDVDALVAEVGGYRILRFDARRGLRGLLDDALVGSGLEVQRGGTLLLQGPVDAEVRSDWRLRRNGEREVICLIGEPEETTSVAVARHLARRGVHVIDVLAPNDGPVQVMRREALALPEFRPPEVAKSTGEVISHILSLLGQQYERNAMVSLFGEEYGPLAGFSLKFCADFGFEHEGKKYVVDLAGVSPRWKALLEKRGYQVLVIPKGSRAQEAAATLLSFLGKDFGEGYTLLGSSRPAANNIRLKVPGLLVDSGDTKYLLSEAEADDGLACALDQAGLRLIQLR